MFGRKRTRALRVEVERLREQLALRNEALNFYAASNNWKRRNRSPRGVKRRSWAMSLITRDHGRIAADALNDRPLTYPAPPAPPAEPEPELEA